MEKYPELIEQEDWNDCILKNTLNYYNNRQVVIWGAFDSGKRIKRILESNDISDIIFVDSDTQKQNLDGVYSTSILCGNTSKYYVIVPLNYKESIVEYLRKNGYEKNKDYYYFCDCIKEESREYYEDYHGNVIYGCHPNFDIMFYGFGATVKIGKTPWILNSKMNVGSNADIEIGDEFRTEGLRIIAKDRTELKIGNKANIESIDFKILHDSQVSIGDKVTLRKNSKIWIHHEATLTIGDSTSIQENLYINVCQYSEMIIGKDCMMSFDVIIMNNSQHSIFDVPSRTNISSSVETCRRNTLTIGNHVWIGIGAMIFQGSNIGNGSIIGAKSFIKNNVPNNCIAIGQPFRITRKNIAWSKTLNSENIDDCGLEYIGITESDRGRGD